MIIQKKLFVIFIYLDLKFISSCSERCHDVNKNYLFDGLEEIEEFHFLTHSVY